MDTGASSHITGDPGKISVSNVNSPIKYIIVGNGNRVPIHGSGHTTLTTPSKTLNLENVLYTPHIVKNLISVRKFAIDNFVKVEFDPFGFTVKDFQSGTFLSRHDSSSSLYPFTNTASATAFTAFAASDFWHDRLGHPGIPIMNFFRSSTLISCNKQSCSSLCKSCQISKHKRLLFYRSMSSTLLPFDIIHCDLWTSPIESKTGFKYYMVLIDDFTNFAWVFPLKYKSDTYNKFIQFHKFIKTQFNMAIKSFQCDLGGEFDNHVFKKFAISNGLQFRFSCPHTSQQNGKSERMIRRLNEIMFCLLTHASLPNQLWVDALHTAAYLHNILPSASHNFITPTFRLYGRHPSYENLRVFGCLCYPNLSSTRPHKLSPRSTTCVFLGYPENYRGYRCLNLATGRIILSRHVTFDENIFPFATSTPPNHSFLESDPSPIHTHTQFFSPHNNQPSPPTPTNNLTSAPNAPPAPPSPTPPHNSPPPPPPPPPQNNPVLPTHHSPSSSHPMQTRSRTGITKPKIPFTLHTNTLSPVPKSHVQALSDPNWHAAMTDEYKALMDNKTWELVTRPSDAPVIRCMWLFRHKFHADGTLQRYKARLVVNGKSQQVGVDCNETFSSVVKPTTIRTVLSLAVSRGWPIKQLDVKNAFLHGDLQETVYMHQPPGFKDPATPEFVCKLKKSLYGLKQAPRAWYQRFASFITKCGFKSAATDTSLFVYKKGTCLAYLLLYVDDIIFTASDPTFIQDTITKLSTEFAMTELGNLHHFLGITATQHNGGLFLSQEHYTHQIIERANMKNCKPCATPVDTDSKLSATSGPRVSDGELYRSLAGALQYLTFTRPDITYAVQQICLFMHDPREPHFQFLKRIIRYLKGTANQGLVIRPSKSVNLTAYSDADWGGCPDSHRSTSGYCVFLGDNIVSWSSKRQTTISRSSAEAEYRGVANTVAETTWLRNLLTELHVPITRATLVYCDNISL
ncbi:hypothetical protein QVD17_30922 [Tagetes erecta]|uniref:Integrase catalytic domain-containing protein n=1 Tax=Tagetes erecta TaxID=13708 RepID=A0AAD8K8T4_TARER|nr:hypothetical protein QVD17_30922 [Tagetes erecta]